MSQEIPTSSPIVKQPTFSLKWSEKLGYASGDLASCLYFGIFMNFLNYFYTDVFGISAAAVATMVFITRTWDWINDRSQCQPNQHPDGKVPTLVALDDSPVRHHWYPDLYHL